MDYILPLVPESIKRIPIYMDYDGQRKAEKWFQIIIIAFAAVGFILGYITQQFSHTVYTLFAGFVLSCLLTLPPWPWYRQKPVRWLAERDESSASTSGASPSTPVASKDKKKKK